MSKEIPDYSGEISEPSPDVMKRLGGLAVKLGQLILEQEELEDRLKDVKKQIVQYQETLLPEVMDEIGLSDITTKGGLRIEMREEVRASLPKDEGKRLAAFRYLRDTGNDGIIKRQFVINYGRDSAQWAEAFAEMLEKAEIKEHATVEQMETIHQQTLLKFLREQLDSHEEVPLESFGAFVQRFARIKRGK